MHQYVQITWANSMSSKATSSPSWLQVYSPLERSSWKGILPSENAVGRLDSCRPQYTYCWFVWTEYKSASEKAGVALERGHAEVRWCCGLCSGGLVSGFRIARKLCAWYGLVLLWCSRNSWDPASSTETGPCWLMRYCIFFGCSLVLQFLVNYLLGRNRGSD